jgi:glycosyltransferase involved in cell wall biosynthesis
VTRVQQGSVRVLAVHRYFWPDSPPYASLLRTITSHWAAAGHRVEVLTSQPSYKPELELARQPAVETVDGVTVRRLPMVPDRGPRLRKPRNVVRFSLLVFLRVLLGRRFDVVMCSTAPPVVLGWFTSLAATLRGARFVYHCMDLHPEIGRMSGEFANPWVYRVLLRLDIATCRRAAAVIVLSNDMRDALVERDAGLAGNIVVLNNFDIPSFEPGERSGGRSEGSPDPALLTLAFTGNIGRYQGLETITEAVLGSDERLRAVRLVLMGEGGAKAGLERLVADAPEDRRDRVRLLPHGTPDQARAVMRDADLGLVSLVPGVIAYAYPSKTASYLSEGLPVLAAVEPDSALARDVAGWGVGAVLSVQDVESVTRELLEWSARRPELAAMRARAHDVWREQFSAEIKLKEWDAVLADVVSPGSSS